MCWIDQLESRHLLAVVPAGFIDEAWGGTLANGTGIEFAPDGRLFVLTQDGIVRIIDADGTLNPTPALMIPVTSTGERGLLGIAFDPNFAQPPPVGNNFIYLYYTTAGASPTNRISRFEVTGQTINPASETIVLNLAISGEAHNGGDIHFGPDGRLYAGVGDAGNSVNAQSISNLAGKMLRLNPDPLNPIPADNPTSFPAVMGTPVGNNRAIWAVGVRNPWTFVFEPITGRMFINDVGAASWEEINHGLSGRNYGWPITEGDFDPAAFPDFTRPLYVYHQPPSSAITAGAAYFSDAPNRFPEKYQGKYFFAEFGHWWISYIDPDEPPPTNGHTMFATGVPFPVDMKLGADGALYYLQRGGGAEAGVRRIVFNPPPAVTASRFVFDGFVLPDAPHRLSYSFSEDVSASLSTADLVLENLTTSTTVPAASIALSYDSASNSATFTFPGFTNGILPDGNYRATLLGAGVTDPQGQPLPVDHLLDFFFLNGDANRDGRVNLVDFNILAGHFASQPAGFMQGDFTYDGIVNLSDFDILAARFGTVLDGSAGARTALPGSTAGVATASAFVTSRIATWKDDPLDELA